jgi:hypothetical protein
MIRRDRCVVVGKGVEEEEGINGGGDENLERSDEDEADEGRCGAACSLV